MQVPADGSVRQIQPGCDCLVRKPLSRELGDVQLLWSELLPNSLGSTKAGFAGCSQLLARTIAPRLSPKCVENAAGLAQWRPRVGGPALPAQPHTISEQEASAQERPA